MFIQRMPNHIQQVLVGPGTQQMTIADLASTADRIMEVHDGNKNSYFQTSNAYDAFSQSAQINAIKEADKMDLILKSVQEMSASIKLLSDQMSRFMQLNISGGRRRSASRGRRPLRSRQEFRSSSGAPAVSPHCFYHNKFGIRAFKCIPPCTFTSTTQE